MIARTPNYLKIGDQNSRIQHIYEAFTLGGKSLFPYAVNTSGQHLQDSTDFNDEFATGTTYSFGPVLTGTDGRYTILYARAPAFWRIYAHSGPCIGQYNGFALHHFTETKVVCLQIGGTALTPGTNASPEEIYTANPPETVTVYGEGLTDVNGMPTVEYYAADGHLAYQTYATSVAGDGTWVSGPPPNLSNCITGVFTLLVRNPDGTGIASAQISVVNDTPCNSDPEQVSNCEMAIGHFWNYDTCRCVDHNP